MQRNIRYENKRAKESYTGKSIGILTHKNKTRQIFILRCVPNIFVLSAVALCQFFVSSVWKCTIWKFNV